MWSRRRPWKLAEPPQPEVKPGPRRGRAVAHRAAKPTSRCRREVEQLLDLSDSPSTATMRLTAGREFSQRCGSREDGGGVKRWPHRRERHCRLLQVSAPNTGDLMLEGGE